MYLFGSSTSLIGVTTLCTSTYNKSALSVVQNSLIWWRNKIYLFLILSYDKDIKNCRKHKKIYIFRIRISFVYKQKIVLLCFFCGFFIYAGRCILILEQCKRRDFRSRWDTFDAAIKNNIVIAAYVNEWVTVLQFLRNNENIVCRHTPAQ